MTLTYSQAKVIYQGDGETTQWAIPFPYLQTADLQVVRIGADGTESVLSGDFTVDPDLNVLLYPMEGSQTLPLAEGEKLLLRRRTPLTQQAAFGAQQSFDPAVLEAGYDKAMMIAQEQAEELARAVRFPAASSTVQTDAAQYLKGIQQAQENADKANTIAQSAVTAAQNALQTAQQAVQNADAAVGTHNQSTQAHADLRTAITQNAQVNMQTATALSGHTTRTDNPHAVTKAQVGLGNADNTSDEDKPVSAAAQAALDLKANSADVEEEVASIHAELARKQDENDFHPQDYGWPDIRPAARPDAIVLLCGVKADYSAYDNLGFTATCEGGYDVFIDGEQYGQTYASGAQCSVTWSQYSATAGFSVLQPEALTAHIVQIVPAVAGNNITAFKCHRVAASGQEAQGVLWVHFNLHTAINIQALLQDYAALYCPVCKAITAVNDLLQITTAADMCGQGADRYKYGAALDYCAELDFGGRTAGVSFNMASGNGGQMRVVRLKNLTDTQMASFCANASSLEKLETDGVLFKPTTVTRAFLNCPNLQYLPQIDFTNTQTAYDFVNGAASLRDTVLDIGYAHLLINFHFCNTPGLKGLLVSAQAPFDYASPPQINVSNTGLGQEALVALFKSLPVVTAGQVINITGASGAASLTAQELAVATDKGWTVTR